MRRGEFRWALGLCLSVLMLWTAGCATMRGAGEDIQSLGRGIKKIFTP